MPNHEIRFKCEAELSDTSEKLWQEVARDFVKTSFQRNVYILGLNSLLEQIKIKRKTLLEVFSKNGKGKKEDK